MHILTYILIHVHVHVYSAVATHPMDTIKTCMQGDIEQKTYKGIRNTYSALMQEKGMFVHSYTYIRIHTYIHTYIHT